MIIAGEQYITYKAATEMCGCCRTKLQAAVSRGHIAAARPGREKLLRLRDVQDWLAAHVAGNPRPAGRPRIRS